ncbi:MAG: hypothetical protein AB7S48_13740 [Bacteroidales bacterium]
MKSSEKFILVFLAIAITYVSINAGSYCNNSFFSTPKADEQSSEYFFESKHNLSFFQRSENSTEKLVENVFSFNIPKFQNPKSDRYFGIEHLQSFTAIQRIEFSSKLRISLTIRDLIYPFDYFW